MTNVAPQLLKKLRLWGFLVCLLALVVALLFVYIPETESVKMISNGEGARFARTAESADTKRASEPKDAPPGREPSSVGERKTEIANATRLQILDPASLKLSKQAAVVLDFSADKVDEVNKELELFTRRIFEEEVARAYVEVSSLGEMIVVPSFDRRPLYQQFKNSITQITNSATARLMVDRITHDIRLGSVTSEIRISFDDDASGKPVTNFTRTVLREKAYDPEIPVEAPGGKQTFEFDTAIKLKTRVIGGNTTDIRLRHLIEAAERLPKKSISN
jgi:hypothetical protein